VFTYIQIFKMKQGCTPRMSTSGMSHQRLLRIDDHLNRNYLEKKIITGSLTLVYRKGRLAHFSALGDMDRERNKPVQIDTIYRIYSMTKPITSVALMTLYEKDLFQLDDPVHYYIPEFRDLDVYVSGKLGKFETTIPDRPMTVRDLLTHQSGLTYDFMNNTEVDAAYREIGVGRKGRNTLKELITSLSTLPLEFSPGDKWNYSISTDVCGYLVELLSGMTLDEFLKENIFDPLGMSDTAFNVPEEKLHRLAANYLFQRKGAPKLIEDSQASENTALPGFLSGGGGLLSTASDYLSFCRMILGNGVLGKKRILSRKTVDLMAENHLRDGLYLSDLAYGPWSESAFEGVGFGLGFSVMMNPALSSNIGSVGELAWGGMANTAFWIDRQEELAVVFMTQLVPSFTFNIRRELRALVYRAIDD